MSLNVNLLRTSFALVVERCPTLTQRFYEILFERHPQTRAMFPANHQRRQEAMLTQALAAVVEHLEDGAWLTRTLHKLGARHADYGVTAEMYDWVGESLLASLREAAGVAWTPEMERAWAAAYGVIASLMQEGARTALAEQQAPSTEPSAMLAPASSA